MDHLNILLQLLIGSNRRLSLKMRENIGTAESKGQGKGACCIPVYILSVILVVRVK